MNEEIDSKLKARLDELKDVPARNPQVAARGRARFLAEAASRLAPVSLPVNRRHRGWKIFTGKENFALMKAVIAAVIALTLILGGTATVYAAQDDLPNEPLYGLKLFTENIRLWANTDPEMEVELLMQFVQLRVQEMNAMAMEGETPPPQVELRLEKQIQQALQVAAGMNDDGMQGTLERIQTKLQEQVQLMTQLQAQAQVDPQTNMTMTQARETIEARLRMVDEGMADPQGFRNTIRMEQEVRAYQTVTPPVQNGSNPPPTDDPDDTNGNGAGGSGSGSGSGSDNGNPDPAQTPDPQGSGGGNGNKP